MAESPSSVVRAAGPRLLDQVRAKIRFKHYSIRTEGTYVDWIRRFILHHGKRHPNTMGAVEVEAFLTRLAVVGRVAASTQNQAKSALLFLDKEVQQYGTNHICLRSTTTDQLDQNFCSCRVGYEYKM